MACSWCVETIVVERVVLISRTVMQRSLLPFAHTHMYIYIYMKNSTGTKRGESSWVVRNVSLQVGGSVALFICFSRTLLALRYLTSRLDSFVTAFAILFLLWQKKLANSTCCNSQQPVGTCDNCCKIVLCNN